MTILFFIAIFAKWKRFQKCFVLLVDGNRAGGIPGNQNAWSKGACFYQSLKFLGEYIIPHNLEFNATTVGGLSAIDYNQQDDIFYILSDDWSYINPARFYTAKISLSSTGIDMVLFPDLPNGHKSLLFVSDNNFRASEKTQFLLFEVIPGK